MLLNMVVQTTTQDDESASNVVRTCTADYEASMTAKFVPDEEKASLCTTANRVLENASIFLHHPNVANNDDFSINHLLAAGSQVVQHLALQQPSCTNNAMEFAYSQSSAIGVFAGAEVHQHGLTLDVLKNFLEYAQEKAISKTTVVQICGADRRGADTALESLLLAPKTFLS